MNSSRLRKLSARNKAIVKILNETQLRMLQVVHERHRYLHLLQNMLTQAMVKLGETEAYVRCLRRDVELVREAIPKAIEHAREIYSRELGEEISFKVEIDEEGYLEEKQIPDFRRLEFDELTDAEIETIFTKKNTDDKSW